MFILCYRKLNSNRSNRRFTNTLDNFFNVCSWKLSVCRRNNSCRNNICVPARSCVPSVELLALLISKTCCNICILFPWFTDLYSLFLSTLSLFVYTKNIFLYVTAIALFCDIICNICVKHIKFIWLFALDYYSLSQQNSMAFYNLCI